MEFREEVAAEFKALQNRICDGLAREDGTGSFREDLWDRPGGGGGASRILRDGAAIEKGGVNFSKVFGPLPDLIKKEFKTESNAFFATGVSIVIHPKNPWVPIIHMNVRYFEMPDTGKYWFGGGIDLTPHYVNRDEAKQFHQGLKTVCDAHDNSYYADFKKWADDYFYIPHRAETRGIGGVFFDHLVANETRTKKDLFDFVLDLGNAFLDLYLPLLQKHKERSFTEINKQWQLLRRGRYVEFNLVYDRGTHFGLKTNGRIESILMSLPLHASWEYDFQPEDGSQEAETLALLRKEIDWVSC